MLTQGYDRSSGRAGPYVGAVTTYTIPMGAAVAVASTAVAAGIVYAGVITIPAGMKFTVTDVRSYQGIVATAAGALSIGTTAGGTDIVNAGAIPVAGAVASTTYTVVGLSTGSPPTVDGGLTGAFIYVQITGGALATIAAPLCVSITGFVSGPPASVAARTVVGTGFAG
jgi:hypothetical protein